MRLYNSYANINNSMVGGNSAVREIDKMRYMYSDIMTIYIYILQNMTRTIILINIHTSYSFPTCTHIFKKMIYIKILKNSRMEGDSLPNTL
jgi:hypothetical protein